MKQPEKIYRSSHAGVFCKNNVLRNFAKFTGKHLCQRLCFNKVAVPRNRCFPVNFAKFLSTPFLIENLRWLLPDIQKYIPVDRRYFCYSFMTHVDVNLILEKKNSDGFIELHHFVKKEQTQLKTKQLKQNIFKSVIFVKCKGKTRGKFPLDRSTTRARCRTTGTEHEILTYITFFMNTYITFFMNLSTVYV